MNKFQVERLIAYIKLHDELTRHEENGMSLALEGKNASADEIAKACIFCEDISYMRDYITDENTLNFNRVHYNKKR